MLKSRRFFNADVLLQMSIGPRLLLSVPHIEDSTAFTWDSDAFTWDSDKPYGIDSLTPGTTSADFAAYCHTSLIKSHLISRTHMPDARIRIRILYRFRFVLRRLG